MSTCVDDGEHRRDSARAQEQESERQGYIIYQRQSAPEVGESVSWCARTVDWPVAWRRCSALGDVSTMQYGRRKKHKKSRTLDRVRPCVCRIKSCVGLGLTCVDAARLCRSAPAGPVPGALAPPVGHAPTPGRARRRVFHECRRRGVSAAGPRQGSGSAPAAPPPSQFQCHVVFTVGRASRRGVQ